MALAMTDLPERFIGPLEVSAVGLGCMNLSHAYGIPPDEQAGGKLLNQALDLGCTFLDTAALYGAGNNERLLGKSVMHRREEFVLASKCVLCLVDGQRTLNGRPEIIAQTLETSLANLQTDFIDLYYLHRLDRDVPVEESVGALVRAKEQGKIGAIGLSEMSAATIRRAHAEHPIAAVQSEYSPMVTNPEIGVLETCEELGIGFVAFSPLMRGLLAKRLSAPDYAEKDLRRNLPRFNEPNWSRNWPMVEKFNALAAKLEMSPGQLSLAWALAKGQHVVPIPGTTDIAHLKENLAAADFVLDEQTVAEIDAICAREHISGARYPAGPQSQIDTETFADEELA